MAIQHPILRRFLSGALLVLFALSITPKKTLHDWIVNHTDGVSHTVKSDIAQLSKDGFNCNCQNLVAESPFTAGYQSVDIAPGQSFVEHPAIQLHQVYTSTYFFFEHRGPPSLA
jgi:hypothetical protein